MIEAFQDDLKTRPAGDLNIMIPENIWLLVKYLIDDGIVRSKTYYLDVSQTRTDGTELRNDSRKLTLTPKGRAFIQKLDAV